MTKDPKPDPVKVIDGVSYALAMADAETASGTPDTDEERLQLENVRAHTREALRALRRSAFEEARARGPAMEPVAVPPRILAMTRDALIRRIRELLTSSAPTSLQVAQREGLSDSDLEAMSEADLQSLLADLEPDAG